jgi:hypothetical protein
MCAHPQPPARFLPNLIFSEFSRVLVAKPCYATGLHGVSAVPIRRFLEQHHAFDPEDVKVLVGAFEDTLLALNLTNRQDPLAISVAKLIIEFAKDGERDPVRLRDLALKSVRPNKP